MPWDPLARPARLAGTARAPADHADAWTPPIDVYETEDRYVVTAEVPGLSREQIELARRGRRGSTIRGQRADAAATAGATLHYHQVERGHGTFARTFEFADTIDIDGVSADLTNGVLTVTLPEEPRPAPHRRLRFDDADASPSSTSVRRRWVFVAGLVLTGRMRTAGEAAPRPRRRRRRPPAPRTQAPAPATAGMPDLTGVAQRAIPA